MPNTELAWRTLDTARANNALDMSMWFMKYNDADEGTSVTLEDLTAEGTDPGLQCGTTACFAGWTAALCGYEMREKWIERVDSPTANEGYQVRCIERSTGEDVGYIADVAANLLLIDQREADRLFLMTGTESIEDVVTEIFGPRPERVGPDFVA